MLRILADREFYVKMIERLTKQSEVSFLGESYPTEPADALHFSPGPMSRPQIFSYFLARFLLRLEHSASFHLHLALEREKKNSSPFQVADTNVITRTHANMLG